MTQPETGPTAQRVPVREADVAGLPVRRALPRRPRRTVGAWCFLDHVGPTPRHVATMDVGPHPHIGLQTVTWLLEGEVRHTDSLGSDQLIRPGQLNLMTAGQGISHAEESTAAAEVLHAAQLWVAQPESTRHGEPAFEHHPELPAFERDGWRASVLVGELEGHRSPARHDTPLLGAELRSAGGTTQIDVDPGFEHGILVLEGEATIAGEVLAPGELLYLGTERQQIELGADEPVVALLLGGEPFEEELVMWWNFVARTSEEIDAARADWEGSDRFGSVATSLPIVPAPPR